MLGYRLAKVTFRASGFYGTRFEVITFATDATVRLHLPIDDDHVRTVNATKAKIDEIQVNIFNKMYI